MTMARVRRVSGAFALAMGLLSAVLIGGCGKSGDRKGRSAPSQPAGAPTTAPRAQYSFADPGVVARYPAAIGFINSFLETCMTGDYLAYRRLVSRYEQPESRERFEAIYKNLRSIVVESVEPLPAEKLALWRRATTQPLEDDIYLVVSTIDFHPEARISLRHRNRQVAILVFREDANWRMCPAPASLQPGGPVEEDETTSKPTSTQASPSTPDYPWESDGDY